MTEAEVRIWAFEHAMMVSPPEQRSTAAVVHAAEPLARWLLGRLPAVEAFPGGGEGAEQPSAVVDRAAAADADGFTLGHGQPIDDSKQDGFSGLGNVGHGTDSADCVNDISVASGGVPVTAIGAPPAQAAA